jgi:guanine deaminase
MEQAAQAPAAPQRERAQDVEEPDDNARKASAKGLIMEVACASALTGVTLMHGGPFGACVVRNGIFVSVAHNTVLMDSDPTCHAEMNAIRYACAALSTHDLSDCELFTTCEPCPMCLGACSWSRIRKIYTGVDRFTAAQFGFDDKVFYDELEAVRDVRALLFSWVAVCLGLPGLLAGWLVGWLIG